MTYASWTIVPSNSSSNFYFTSATNSINYYNANTVLTPFKSDGLTNVAVKMTGSGYQVGDIGLGGGTIFYVSTDGFNCGTSYTATGSPYGFKCYYLEVAPRTWQGIASPARGVGWATTSFTSTDIVGITNLTTLADLLQLSQVGLGGKNSQLISDQNGTCLTISGCGNAASQAKAYLGGGLNDWYLPTFSEMNLLCQWARNLTQSVTTRCSGGTSTNTTTNAGLQEADGYWTSSEFGPSSAWYLNLPAGGSYAAITKSDGSVWVRPIRAF
jgi:hypothetical protein